MQWLLIARGVSTLVVVTVPPARPGSGRIAYLQVATLSERSWARAYSGEMGCSAADSERLAMELLCEAGDRWAHVQLLARTLHCPTELNAAERLTLKSARIAAGSGKCRVLERARNGTHPVRGRA